jgi:hypothetical protein
MNNQRLVTYSRAGAAPGGGPDPGFKLTRFQLLENPQGQVAISPLDGEVPTGLQPAHDTSEQALRHLDQLMKDIGYKRQPG